MLAASQIEITELKQDRDDYKGQIVQLINQRQKAAENKSIATVQLALNNTDAGAQIDPLMPVPVSAALQSSALSRLDGKSADNLHISEIKKFVGDWAQSWSQQKVSSYLAFYAPEFRPANGMNNTKWKQLRGKRLTKPSFIEVGISDLKVVKNANGNFRATFAQDYRTDSYRDQVVKTLELEQANSGWKIVSEESL